VTDHQNRAKNRWFGFKITRKKATKTGLTNWIIHASEAGNKNKNIYQACFAEKNKGLTTNKTAKQA